MKVSGITVEWTDSRGNDHVSRVIGAIEHNDTRWAAIIPPWQSAPVLLSIDPDAEPQRGGLYVSHDNGL
jgi:hypothetical protein